MENTTAKYRRAVYPERKQGKRTSDMYAESTRHAARRILEIILADYCGPVAVRLWNGDLVIGDEGSPCSVIFRSPAPIRNLALRPDIVHLAESYLAGEVDVNGDMEALFDLVDYLQIHAPRWTAYFKAVGQALRISAGEDTSVPHAARAGRKARRNSRASIAHHYDVGNEFYRLWLDPEMVYSCAYFKDAGQTLAEAQRDKLDYICRKLRLEPGQTLLDIGCGWGALAIWAARHYGVTAHGITLSECQYSHAVKRVRSEGLEDLIRIELRDYRELPENARYDRVVSVGMFEHIGISNFPAYFGVVSRALKPGGLFLNHGISNNTENRSTPLTRFINRYVFPDGELARLSDAIDAMERSGFEILDVEGLRRHYAMTLRHWVRALKTHKIQAVETAGEATCRLWRLYMSGYAYYFEQGDVGVYQVLAGRARQPLFTPLRRDDIYRTTGEKRS